MKKNYISDIIKYRLEQAQQSIEDAEFLFKNNRNNSSIINRCYYSMFYSVLAILVNKKFSGSKHTGVIAYFDKEFVNKGAFPKQLSKDFHKAFDMRGKSDYKEFVEYSRKQVKKLLNKSINFNKEINDFILKGLK